MPYKEQADTIMLPKIDLSIIMHMLMPGGDLRTIRAVHVVAG
jgi:hypothetical protein